VNNTDPNLTNTDTFNDGETSITVNPANPDEIVVTAFSGSWGAHAPLWQSTDGGHIWTKRFTIPAPPGIAATGCPCDQTIDYGTANQMAATFLINDIFSGITTNPASPVAWNWLVIGGGTQATNFNNSPPPGGVDQPWLLVNTDPMIPTQDNVYDAYDDFTNGNNCVGDACIERVAVSYGVNPPNFTVDNQSGTATGSINPGHRLAIDPRNGSIYSLFQRNIAPGAGGSKNIDYMLNRSTDGGATWTLNGMTGGIIVANGDGTVGVFYYTFDGFSQDNLPIFSAHLAQSRDQGVTFNHQTLLTFLSSAADNGNSRQRVLGDYMQMRAVDGCFYGAFTGNGVPFGRPFANHDPIFLRVCAVAPPRPTPTPRSRPTPAPRPTPPR